MPAGDEVSAEPAPRRRVIVHGRTFEALDESERVVVEEAAALVRDVVAKVAPDAVLAADPAAIRHARRTGARAVRRQVSEWRRHAAPDAPHMSARKAAKLRRLLNVLVEYAFADGAPTDGLRWPDGVDFASALQDLIRVLSAAPADAATQGPDLASDAQPDGATPSTLPDMR